MSRKKSDYIGIFYPKKGPGKYIGLPFWGLAVMILTDVLFTLFIRSRNDSELNEFLILNNFTAFYFVQSVVLVLETVCQWISTSKYGGKSPKRLMLLRTAPEMEKILTSAFISDEIRKAVLFICTGGLSAAAAGLTGIVQPSGLIAGAIYTAGSAYFISSVATAITRLTDNFNVLFILVYLWIMITEVISCALLENILTGDNVSRHVLAVSAVVIGAVTGVITCKAAIKNAVSSRHPDGI